MRTQDKLISIFYCFSIAITWSTTNLFLYPKLVQAQSINSILLAKSRRTLDFSGTGRPNNQSSGGTRGLCGNPDKIKNKNSNVPVALVPQEMGLTISEHPTFWVYIPDKPENIKKIDLVINDSQETKTIIELSYKIQSTPGIITLNTANAKNRLTEGETYRWYVKIFCAGTGKRKPIEIQGSIKKVKPNFQPNYENYINNKIWYDALTDLAKRLKTAPKDARLNNDWADFLNAKGVDLGKLVDQPIVECCQLKD